MIGFGLTGAQKLLFAALLQSHHRIEIHLTLMDLDHNEKTDITTRLVDGQVTFDADADVTRSLDLDLFDPTGSLHLDSKSPDDGAMFADRMIRIRYTIVNPLGTQRYTVPIFTGPITSLERNDAVVHVEAQGKESLSSATVWSSKTYKKGARVTTSIKDILVSMVGENKYNLPDLDNKLPRNVSVGPVTDKDGNVTSDDKSPWKAAKDLASSIGYQLFYDGNGEAQMRKKQTAPMFTMRQDAGGCMKSKPTIGFDTTKIINCVEVFGKAPEKTTGSTSKKQPHYRLVAPKAHPLSPWSLGRSGGPRYLPLIINDETILTDADAQARAKDELAHGMLASLSVSYDTLPIVHLEELDVVRLNTVKYTTDHLMKQFAIPLTAGGTMTVGYVKNVKTKATVNKQIQKALSRAAR
jgi:hypothetical protein